MEKVKDSAKGFLGEFKKFIARGNVIDLAVGVVIGGAFGNIVSSLVNDIIMPVIGVILGGVNFRSLTIRVKDATIYYGSFIQNIIDFLIIAFCIFLVVKFVNKFMTKKEEAKPEAPKKSDDIVLLEEIRDLLKDQSKKNK
jgi:large conductance mechanosensitive channel